MSKKTNEKDWFDIYKSVQNGEPYRDIMKKHGLTPNALTGLKNLSQEEFEVWHRTKDQNALITKQPISTKPLTPQQMEGKLQRSVQDGLFGQMQAKLMKTISDSDGKSDSFDLMLEKMGKLAVAQMYANMFSGGGNGHANAEQRRIATLEKQIENQERTWSERFKEQERSFQEQKNEKKIEEVANRVRELSDKIVQGGMNSGGSSDVSRVIKNMSQANLSSLQSQNEMAKSQNFFLENRIRELTEENKNSGGLKGISELSNAMAGIKKIAPTLGLQEKNQEKPLAESLIGTVVDSISKSPGFNQWLANDGLGKVASKFGEGAKGIGESLSQAQQNKYTEEQLRMLNHAGGNTSEPTGLMYSSKTPLSKNTHEGQATPQREEPGEPGLHASQRYPGNPVKKEPQVIDYDNPYGLNEAELSQVRARASSNVNTDLVFGGPQERKARQERQENEDRQAYAQRMQKLENDLQVSERKRLQLEKIEGEELSKARQELALKEEEDADKQEAQWEQDIAKNLVQVSVQRDKPR